MKRCPDCEFIYEDEQDLCDMDGRELERVPAALIGPLRAATRPTRPKSARRRRLLVMLIPGAVLAALLTSGYYVQPSQTATGRADDAPSAPAATGSQAEVAPPGLPPEAPSPSPAPPPKTKVRPPAETPQKRTAAAAKIGGPAVKPPAPAPARREERTSRPEKPDGRQDSKKGSKLGAALKKAGRVLKKPFGF